MTTTEVSGTTFGASPSEAQWYYNAVVDVDDETTYVYGYASGEEPTMATVQEYAGCHFKFYEWQVIRIR